MPIYKYLPFTCIVSSKCYIALFLTEKFRDLRCIDGEAAKMICFYLYVAIYLLDICKASHQPHKRIIII